ncbi:MAG: alpha/beta fold hydrolase [Planctomycetota bacterium]
MNRPADRLEGHAHFDTRPRWRLRGPADAGPEPRPLVIALHGMGHDGARLLDQLDGALDDRVLLVPDAPLPYETRDAEGRRGEGRAWYVYTGDQAAFLDSAARAEDYLFGLVDAVAARAPIDASRLALLGYSQGGYLAGIIALRHPERFGAVVVVNARIKHEIATETPGPTPEFLVLHGERDRFIPVETARESARLLAERGLSCRFETNPGGHSLRPEQAARAAAWLAERGFV